jgi:transposase InsO family protein
MGENHFVISIDNNDHACQIRRCSVGARRGIAVLGLRERIGEQLSVEADPARCHHRGGWRAGYGRADRRQMTEADPWDTAPRYLLRDRDKSYGPAFRHRIRAMGVTEVITAPRSPWQNPYVERLIGSIRRECLDHIIIFNERHLRRVLSSYFQYHHDARTHLSLNKDGPRPRPVQLASAGNIIAFPEVDGLHHRYERRAA